MATKKQFAAIDIAKYISALLVVCIHTFPFLEVSAEFNSYWIALVCRLAVPFFFVTSGFFFFKKLTEDDQANKEILIHYLKRLGKIYLIWTVIYIPYTIFLVYGMNFSITNLLMYIRDFFLNGSYYHLWFLPALMLATTLVYIVNKHKGMIFTLKVAMIFYVIGYLLNVYAPFWQSVPGVNIFFDLFTKVFVTSRNGIFFGPIFVALGLLLARTKKLPQKTSLIGFGISYALVIVEVFIYSKLGMMRDLTSMFLFLVPAVFFLVNYLLKVKMPYKPIYKELRIDSLLIYTSHILFSVPLLKIMPDGHLVAYFLTLALAQGFAYLVTQYKDRYPILQHLL